MKTKGETMQKIVVFFRLNANFEESAKIEEKAIKEYLFENKIKKIDVVQVEVSAPNQEENMREILELKANGETLLTYSLYSFGRTIQNIVSNIEKILENGFKIVVLNQNLVLIKDDMLTQIILKIMIVASDMERDLISLRTKEALITKKNDGMALGKPKGTIQKSKFDEQRDKIEELLALGVSVRKIAKQLGYNNHIGINNYVKRRNIREISKSKDNDDS